MLLLPLVPGNWLSNLGHSQSHPALVMNTVLRPSSSTALHNRSKVTESVGQALPPPGRSSTDAASGSALKMPHSCHSDRNGVTWLVGNSSVRWPICSVMS
jgi:hypothetical protein